MMGARSRRVRRVVAIAVALTLATAGLTAANSVPASHAGQQATAISANALKPANCSGITLATLVTGNGTFSGTGAANLVIGGASIDSINAGGGNDCVLGGDGNDILNGGTGSDVCIGGPGTDTFTSCAVQVQ